MKQELVVLEEGKDEVKKELVEENFTKEEIKDLLLCAICSDVCKRGIKVLCCNRHTKHSFCMDRNIKFSVIFLVLKNH